MVTGLTNFDEYSEKICAEKAKPSHTKKYLLEVVSALRPNNFEMPKKALHTQTFAMTIRIRTQGCDGML